ncbi:related to MLH3 - insertion and deletion mismatch repair protein [Ustilago sp. UG-2017b]|nr:related to MLH3 - insertion and deletion mismatch repair protein [Ustilago sp. UG-2017b]
MDAIEKLPERTAASIQASLLAVKVEDVCRILFRHALQSNHKLFRNSAGKISLSVDYATWTITLSHQIDPGSQLSSHSSFEATEIEQDELSLLSHLGLVHITLTSSSGTEARIWQEGRRTLSELPSTPLVAPPSSSRDASTRGVTISVRDVFHAMPVRRRLILSEAERKSRMDPLAHCLRELSLLTPEATFKASVQNAAPSDGSLPAFKDLLRLPRAKSLLHRCRAALGANDLDSNRMQTISQERAFAAVKIWVDGFICPALTAHVPQIIFLQGRIWPGSNIRSGLEHSDRDSAVFASLLSTFQLGWTDEVASRRARHHLLSPDLYRKVNQRILAVPESGRERRVPPNFAFVLRITLTKGAQAMAQPEGAPALDAASFEATLLDAISNGTPETDDTGSETSRKRKRSSRSSTASEAQCSTPAVSPIKTRPATSSLATESRSQGGEAPDGMVEWRDPVNGRLFHVDLRTGHSIPVNPSSPTKRTAASPRVSAVRQGLIVDCSSLRRGVGLSVSKRGAQTIPVGDSDDEFDDPSLDAALASIPSPSRAAMVDVSRQSRFFDSRRPESSSGIRPLRNDQDVDLDEAAQGLAATELELAISRSDLQDAQVLDQVDGKFILCTTSPSPISENWEPVLFCIDQHAADERCRLERLLHDYVKGCKEGTAAHALPATLTLAITVKQYELITSNAGNKEGLAKLGWVIEKAVMVHAELGHAQVDLRGVPYVLRERTLTDKGRVKDQGLLHSVFVACLDELATSPSPSAKAMVGKRGSDWLTASRTIPIALMDIIKSTACRSAIMFNDPLSQEASERLARRLAECRFPFQCAHGRPSLVPLCEIKTRQQRAGDAEDVISYNEIMQC